MSFSCLLDEKIGRIAKKFHSDDDPMRVTKTGQKRAA
jgi:hypothetical protein